MKIISEMNLSRSVDDIFSTSPEFIWIFSCFFFRWSKFGEEKFFSDKKKREIESQAKQSKAKLNIAISYTNTHIANTLPRERIVIWNKETKSEIESIHFISIQ